MSSAARLDIDEQELAQHVAHIEAATLDLAGPDAVIDLSDASPSLETAPPEHDLLPAAENFTSESDDPAMLFVYVGAVLFVALLVLAAVLALG